MATVWTIRALGALLVGVFLVVLAHAETIELVTYYPTQTTGGNAGFTSLTVGTVPPGVTPATPLHVFGQDDQSSIVAFTRGPGGTGTGTISVGIGTAAPAATLHVVGGVYILGGNGDVNGDGSLTSADSLLIANFLNNPVANPLTPAQYAAADTNGDGVVDTNDFIAINAALTARPGGAGPPLSEAERQFYKTRNYLAETLFADANRNLGIGAQPQTRFQVTGHADDASVASFMPGLDTAASGVPSIRVGIGTTAPRAALHVVGGLYVLGGDGDVITDSVLAPNDALRIINYLNDPIANNLTNAEWVHADVDGDGIVGYNDAIAIVRALNAGIATPLSEAQREVAKRFNVMDRAVHPDIDGNVGIGSILPGTDGRLAGGDPAGGLIFAKDVRLSQVGRWASEVDKPDYNSGWVSDNNTTRHKTRFTHNLNMIPRHITIYFAASDNPTTVYPIQWGWDTPNYSGNPVTIEMTSTQIILNIVEGSPLHGVWNADVPGNAWTKYDSGYWRVLAWD